ncbi:MAG: outer membrane lipoprotein carrier protein LolA [Myxococcales bacterium]|nr:outer membrane lipoprotein carrier protein LolA [Myxococcales bacterium]
MNRLQGLGVWLLEAIRVFRTKTKASVYALLAGVLVTPILGYGIAVADETGHGTATGAKALDPLKVAASVQAFYDQTQDVSAQFRQMYVHRLYNRTERSHGQVVFKKPGKMRWDYGQPNGKIIVADGQRVRIFEPGQEGEPDQVLEQRMSAHQLPQAMAFLMGTGRLENDFNFRLLDAGEAGFPSGHILELRPKEPTPHYVRVLFYVDSRPAVRGLVRRLIVIDADGNRNRFDFDKLRFNSGVTDQPFAWRPPAGTRRVEM